MSSDNLMELEKQNDLNDEHLANVSGGIGIGTGIVIVGGVIFLGGVFVGYTEEKKGK